MSLIQLCQFNHPKWKNSTHTGCEFLRGQRLSHRKHVTIHMWVGTLKKKKKTAGFDWDYPAATLYLIKFANLYLSLLVNFKTKIPFVLEFSNQ